MNYKVILKPETNFFWRWLKQKMVSYGGPIYCQPPYCGGVITESYGYGGCGYGGYGYGGYGYGRGYGCAPCGPYYAPPYYGGVCGPYYGGYGGYGCGPFYGPVGYGSCYAPGGGYGCNY